MPYLLFLILLGLSGPLFGRQPEVHFQKDWEPNEYRIVCGNGGCSLGDGDRQYVIDMLKKAVGDFRTSKFKTPTWWAPRKQDEAGNAWIELTDTGKNNDAYVSCIQYGGWIWEGVLNVGNKFGYFRDYGAHHMAYSNLVHELFHLSQYEYPFWDPAKCDKAGGIPGWLQESMAQAYGIYMMKQAYPSYWPPSRSISEAEDRVPMRDYTTTLAKRVQDAKGNEVLSGVPEFYRTASFWLHLAEVHHGGSMDFLDRYMQRTPPAGDGWVSWLRGNMMKHTGEPLDLVFAGFLADYAGWGDPDFPAQLIKRKPWLEGVFKGCRTVYLNKSEPADYEEFTLVPISGQCVEVAVPTHGPSGLAEGESATVQIAGMVMSGAASARGGLHLGMAISNDKEQFHCARELRQKGKKAIGKCIFTPDDGKVRFGGSEMDARVWEVRTQEIDPNSADTELKNIYTLSYTPTQISLRDSSYNSRYPVTFRLYFALDVTTTTVDGENMKGAVGVVGTPNADPQTTLPKKDASGRPVGSFSKPDSLQPPFSPPAMVPPEMQGRLGQLTVSIPASGDSTAVTVLPAKAGPDGKLEAYPLVVGDTGRFPAIINAFVDDEMAVSLGDASIEVMEFSDLVLRARYQGTLCRTRDLVPSRPGQPVENPCRNPFPVGGETTKGFVGSRLPGNFMVVERTEGTEIYRKAAERGMAAWMESGAPDESGDPGPGDPGSPGSSGSGTLGECQCTCEERETNLLRAEELTAREAAGETITAGEIMGLMRCEAPCRSQYFSCEMEAQQELQAQRAIEAEARREELNDGCDCSCDTLRGYESRLESLLNDMAAGKPGAQAELQKAGQCMEVCMGAMMQCSR